MELLLICKTADSYNIKEAESYLRKIVKIDKREIINANIECWEYKDIKN